MRGSKRNKISKFLPKSGQRQRLRGNFKLEKPIETLVNWNLSNMTGTTDSTSQRVRTTWKCILSTDSTSIRNRRSSPPVSGSGTQVRWMSSLASLNLELGFIPRRKSLIIHKRGHTKTSKKLCMSSELLSIYRKGNQVLSHQPRSISKWQQGGRVISQLWKADVTKKDTRPIVSFSTSRCLSTSRRREARQPPISLNPWRCTIVSLL